MNARRVAKELETVTRGLNKNMPATPPTVDREEIKQVRGLLTQVTRWRGMRVFFVLVLSKTFFLN